MRALLFVLFSGSVACRAAAPQPFHPPTRSAMTRAAFELRCPEGQLALTQLDPLMVGIDGCGQRAVYVYQVQSGAWVNDGHAAPAASSTGSTGSADSNAPSGF